MIDTKDIRQRLSENTAIDAKEIQALCDEVENLRSILGEIKEDHLDNTYTGYINLGIELEKRIKELNGE